MDKTTSIDGVFLEKKVATFFCSLLPLNISAPFDDASRNKSTSGLVQNFFL